MRRIGGIILAGVIVAGCGDDGASSNTDAGPDAGLIIDDFGMPIVDSGSKPYDAGTPGEDAATPEDLGPPPPIVPVIGGHWVTNTYGTGSDQFGQSVIIDGERAFVGAPGVSGEGAVYVFERLDDWWWPVTELTALLGNAGDAIGWSLAVDGSTLAVGAPRRASFFTEAGEVFIFAETPDGWVERSEVTRDPGTPMNAVGSGGHFGHRLALSADHLIVAAPAEGRSVSSGGVNPDVGAIYVYDHTGGGFSSPTALRAPGTDPDDFFSSGMASDGRHIVASCIASPCDEQVFVFDADANWAQQTLSLGGAVLGPEVAVDQGVIAVRHDAHNVFVFHEEPSGDWAEDGLLFDPLDVGFEILEIAVSGPYILVATGQTMSPGEGLLWLFEKTDDGFIQRDRVSLSSDWSSDGFGASLFFNGEWGAVGAPSADEGRGAAYFFRLVSESCIPKSCAPDACGSPPESDGCGGRIDCGGCTSPDTCGGTGVPYLCGCAERVAAGPRSPTTTSGSGTWMNTELIESSDDLRAETGALIQGGSSGVLKAQGFGFAIPSDATIEGIEVRIERVGNGSFADQAVRILKAGAEVGDDHAHVERWENTGADDIAAYGHPTDLWGTTWTPEEINAADFGVAFSATYENTAGNGRVYVDHISVRVYYGVTCP